ncbi:MAG: NAD(+) synthase [Firmicutes bacterium HGW-Firmicutes-1]|nr:MAG: NAD(+) synthase [Firmicutes bacterium HGW-Firmicutes-1]
MTNYGFIRVAAASPEIKVGYCSYNTNEIIHLTKLALTDKASLIVFPELCITGYTCGDLFFQQQLISEALKSLIELKSFSIDKKICMIVGLPVKVLNSLYNCAAFICNGKIIGLVPKSFMPNYNEFYEHRWFASANDLSVQEIIIDREVVPIGADLIFAHNELVDFKLGIEICEDLWTPIPPSTFLTLNGATLIANPSASNELVSKIDYRKQLLSSQSARTVSGYIYASAGFGESTTDVVYGGHCLIYENGAKLLENKRFQLKSNYITSDIDLDKLAMDRIRMTTYRESSTWMNSGYRQLSFDIPIDDFELSRKIDPHPFVPKNKNKRDERCEEIFSIQTSALAKRIRHIGCNKVVIGVSGGLDSTLALLVCAKTFDMLKLDKKNMIGVTMPGFGTTDRTYTNALLLIEKLGATKKEIPIQEACMQHFEAIGHDPLVHDITYENVQARERTQILMDLSNKEGAIVIGTGDLSELALGWATYNGDHMSMYGVNASIPKTLVRYLVEWVASKSNDDGLQNTLSDILLTPVSPELLPPDHDGNIQQKTEEVIGPYELHDFFLYNMVRYGYTPIKILFLAEKAFEDIYTKKVILSWLKTFYKRFFSQQFKRSCLPDGPKVGSICLSPRGDWRMPSDAAVACWLKDLDEINA